jgi:hypothetical protein
VKIVVIRQFGQANYRILAGNDPAWDTTNTKNNMNLMKGEEESKLHRIAKVHDSVEMWQASQNLPASQQKSHAQNKQTTAIENISETEEIIEGFW